MNSLNKVQLIGNLTADAEVKQTPSGQKVATFSIATNRSYKDASGAKQEQVEYHNIVAWGYLADLAEQYFVKGKKLYIEGRLQTRSWEDQAGVKKYKTEIVSDNIMMLSGGERGEGATSYTPATKVSEEDSSVSASKSRKTTPKSEEEINLADIPF